MEERRLVTVFFSDLTEFTKLCDKADPEEVKEILDSVFSIIEENTMRYGGRVVKIIGDCAMCVFGVPKALENSSENALLAIFSSYEIINKILGNLPHSVKLHTGVHTGEVLFEKMENNKIDVIGDTVNVASRLKDFAKAGEIVVSEEVYKKTKHIFDFKEIGDVKLKGKEKFVRAFKLLDKKEERGKIRGIEGLETPLIGREKEMQEIMNSFENYKREKKDFIILIKGEPGIGKTRLYEEFKKAKGGEVLILEGRSLPTETESFYPIGMILQNLIGKKGKKIFETLFPEGKAGFIPISPFLSFILKGEIPEELKNLSPWEFKKQKFFVVENILRKISEKESLVLCFEDIHWADEETVEFLKYIFSSPQSYKGILFFILSRPPVKEKNIIDFFKFLNGIKEKIVIDLKTLDFKNSMKLINTLLNIERLPTSLKKQILFGKSEGNPFFIEEIIKMLIERGIIYRDGNEWKSRVLPDEIGRMPSTVEEIIISRVDSLNEEERSFLKVASVIGDRFFEEGVKTLLKREKGFEINNLINSGFIKPLDSRFLNFKEYGFKHILIQEAVYNTLLKRERKYYHLEFARYLENLFEKGYDISEGIIADHFEKGGDFKRSFIYNERYAIKCKRNYSNFEAIRRYKKILDFSFKFEEFSDKRSSIYHSLGNLYNIVGSFESSVECLRKALELAKDNEERAKIFNDMANTYQRASFYREALFYLETAEKYAGENKKLIFSILREKAWINYLIGNFEECREILKRCEKMLDVFEDEKEKKDKKAMIENLMGSYYAEMGDFKKALSHYESALRIYENLEDIHGKSVIYNNMGSNLYRTGRVEEAIKMLYKSLEIEKNTGNYLGYAITCNNLGEMYLFVCDLEKSEKFFREYLRVNKKIRNRLGDGYGYLGLAEVRKRAGKVKEAEKFYLRSISILKEVKSEVVEKRAKICLANFYIDSGREEKGMELLEDIKEYALNSNHIIALFCTHLLFSRYYVKMFLKTQNPEHVEIAEAYIKRASEIMEENVKDKIAPVEFYKILIEYYRIKGDEGELRKAMEGYENSCREIIDGIKNESYKRGFLKHPDFFYFIYS